MIAFTDPTVHPVSPAFYRQFPWEPIAPRREIKVQKVVEIQRMTLESLLARIPNEVGQGGDVMIIYHGTADGLSLPITNQQRRVNAEARVLNFILNSNLSLNELGQRLLVNSQVAERLRQLCESVRNLRLNCVLLRACNTGQNRPGLEVTKRFFGARVLGAPDLRDAYVPLNPGRPNANPGYRQRWLARFRQTKLYEVPRNGWLALAPSNIVPGQIRFQLSALTDSNMSVGFWTDVYISRLHSAYTYSGRPVPIHAIIDPTSFPLVFPGEEDYTRHLVMV